ncbi:ATP-grasp fold amidoligase family protein [Microvirga sp. 2YAF29]|uniref:ATP-grasp fold amidoligase family protein n=1 Tax=Microvirga sp. 2YAF29 TaxID=3233031 RepID=UPI003F9E8700
MTDKVKVRDYVRERVGERYLIPVYKITTDMESIQFEELPSSFAMKASHGCGWNEFVRDNDGRNTEFLRKKAQHWLGQNFYHVRRERHYKEIPPRIMFEELLIDRGVQPNDYKIHCFRRNDALTQIIQVHFDRFGDHKVNFFTADWEAIPLSHGYKSLPPTQVQPPENLEEMLNVARILSSDLNYVRVDLYSLGGKIYFGEMTFTPGAGLMCFNPLCADKQWASLFDPDRR